MQIPQFQVGVIRPFECLKEGWELIKDQYWLFLGITFVGIIIASIIPFGILIGPMLCGIFLCFLQKMDRQPVKFDSLFKGFSFFGPSFVASLFMIIPAFIIIIAMYIPLLSLQFSFMQNRNPSPDEVFSFLQMYFAIFGVGMLAVWLVLGTIHTLMIFAFPLITEHKMSGIEASKLSARAAMKNLGGIVGLIGMQFLLGIAGYLVLCFGLYFVLPVIFASNMIAYRKVFPLNREGGFDTPPPPSEFRGAGQAF